MLEPMSTSDQIEQHSFCYDPDFPPDVAEGLPLVAVAKTRDRPARSRRALRAAATALAKRRRSP
jgi:hypothetical protein